MWVVGIVGGLICGIPMFGNELSAPVDRRPNVVVILVDDIGYAEFGFQGATDYRTPNSDRLAAQGVRFTQGYVTAPYCSPSRAGLLTGRYQTRFGHELNPVGEGNLSPEAGLPLTERTFADVFKTAGYATACIGKWHLGGLPEYHPQKRGFDVFFGFLHEGHYYVPDDVESIVNHFRPVEPPYNEHNPLLRGTTVVDRFEYLTEAFSREACAFIRKHADRPFFLYLAYNACHSPMQATPEWFEKYADIEDPHRRVFAAMMGALDRGIGDVLRTLAESGLDERTLVVLLSDNGGPVKELTSRNDPLRGGKGQLWEGGIRIPFVIRWKGVLPAGTVYRHPVISTDILPTASAAAGISAHDGIAFDGVDLLPYLQGRTEGRPHETLYWRYGENIALRHGDWKLVRQRERGNGSPRFQLFDLAADLGETTDLSEARAEVAERLKAILDELDAQMVPPRYVRKR
ncbi:N-acetylgalactosamine-6-sulfatase [Thermostilla marina]